MARAHTPFRYHCHRVHGQLQSRRRRGQAGVQSPSDPKRANVSPDPRWVGWERPKQEKDDPTPEKSERDTGEGEQETGKRNNGQV